MRQFSVYAQNSVRLWKDKLEREIQSNGDVRTGVEYCSERLRLTILRIKMTMSEKIASASAISGDEDPLNKGLETWDHVHHEISDIVTMFPDVILDPDATEMMVWGTSDGLLPESHENSLSTEKIYQGPLTEFFKAFDRQLSWRQDIASAYGPSQSSIPSNIDAPCSGIGDNVLNSSDSTITTGDALHTLFSNNNSWDWNILAGVLATTPMEFSRSSGEMDVDSLCTVSKDFGIHG